MIYLDFDSNVPLYRQLYEQLKSLIISGIYLKGTKLTSTRELARTLNVGRNTVEIAYHQLSIEGYIDSKPGSRYEVKDFQDILDMAAKMVPAMAVAPSPVPPPEKKYPYRFIHGRPDCRTFPHSLWRRITNEVMHDTGLNDLYEYGDKQGEHSLRLEISRYLYRSRGVNSLPEQIVVAPGIQELMGTLCILFNDKERLLAMEEPGYDVTRLVFSNHGYDIRPVPVGETGIDYDKLTASGAKLVYITPSHQLPTGAIMPIQNRLRLLKWAEQTAGIIIEDDYDSEFRYNTRPIPALQSIDRFNRVIYLGTFSKALAPGLRMAYMVLPPWLLPEYHRRFIRYKCPVPRLQQHTMACFMAEGHWEKHLRRICVSNKKKHDLLIQTLHQEMGDRVRIKGHNAGLHVRIEFVNGETQEDMVKRAADCGVKVSTSRHFWHNPQDAPDNLILMGFGVLTNKEIVEGIGLLRQVWFDQ